MTSIIIPCYNGARYIARLFACLGRQSSKKFEVIFIDDGSSDDSFVIAQKELNKYSFKCSIIKVENGGVSRARNIGLDCASGDYIMFIDVDDLITDDRVEYINELFVHKKADAIITASQTVLDDGITTESFIPVDNRRLAKIDLYTKDDILSAFLSEKVHTGVCGGVFRRDIIESNGIRFLEGLKYSEDLHFMWRILACCQTVCVSDRITYHYMWVPNSAMSRFGNDRLDGYKEVLKLAPFIQLHAPQFSTLFERYAAQRILWSIARQGAVYLKYRPWIDYFNGIDLIRSMRNLRSYPNVFVSFSAICYLLSPCLFYILARVQSRTKTNTRSTVKVNV